MNRSAPILVYHCIFLLVLLPILGDAQTIVANTSPVCTNSSKLEIIDNASMIYKIEWIRNGSSVDQTNYREWGNPVVVAGTEGQAGNSATHLNQPMRIFVTPAGSVYVVENVNDRVQRWDPPYTTGVTVASNLDWGEDVQVDLIGQVLVSEHWGQRIGVWPSGGTVANVGGGADGIAMSTLGAIYVANFSAHRIVMYPFPISTATTPTVKAGVTNQGGGALHQLSYPIDVHVDIYGNMFVIDEGNSRIMYYPSFSVEGYPGTEVVTGVPFSRGSSVWRDMLGYLFYTCADGTFILEPGGTQPRKLNSWGRYGMQGDIYGNLYLTDFGAHCVKKLSPSVDVTFTATHAGNYQAKIYYLDGQVKWSNTIDVHPSPPAPTVSSNSPVCEGGTIQLTADAGPNVNYVWTAPGGFNITGQNQAITNVSPANSGEYKVQANGYNGCASPVSTINVTVQAIGTPSVTISPDAGTNVFCAGSTVSFTANAADGGASPQFQWTINGNPAGSGPTFSTAALNDGDVVLCELTSNAWCISTTPVTSNAITMAVSPNATLGTGPVCAGAQLTVNPQASIATVEWYRNTMLVTSTSSGTFTAGLAGTYHAVVTSQEGCVSTTDPIVVMANNTPSVTISTPATEVCAGSAVTFTPNPSQAGTNPVYEWSRNGQAEITASQYSPATLQPGDVISCRMTVDADAGCVTASTAQSNDITMTVNPLPQVNIGSNMPSPVCGIVAQNFTATTSAGTPVYQWKVNDEPAGGNSASLSVPAVQHGDVIRCIVTDMGHPTACVDSTFITRAVNPLPSMASTTGNTSLCVDATTQLTNATVNNSYEWKSLQPGVATIDNAGNVIGVSPGTSTVRFVAATAAGCSDSTDILVTVKALPAMLPITSATSQLAVCDQGTLQLHNATIRQTEIWKSLQPATAAINVAGKLTGLQAGAAPVRFIATNAAGCTDSTEVTITVNGLPAMQPITSVNSSFAVCAQSNLTLNNATIRQTHVWKSLQPTVASINASGILTGLADGTTPIRFIATNAAGCTDSTDIMVTVKALPTMEPITSATGLLAVCNQGTLQLSNATVRQTDVWKSLQPTVATIDAGGRVHAMQSGTVPIRFVATNALGCTDSTDATLIVNALPAMQPIGSLANSFTVCEQSTLQLQNATIRQTEVWKSLNVSIATVDATGKLNALQGGTALIRFIAINAAGCSDSTDMPVTVIPLVTPFVSINASGNPVCEDTEVIFSAQSMNGGSSPQYQWLINGIATGSNSNTFSSRSLNDGDEVICRLTSNAACPSPAVINSNSIRMQINPLPVLSISAERFTILKGDMVALQATATGNIGTISWTPVSDLNNDTILSPVARPLTNTRYRLTVTSAEGCTSSGEIAIEVVDRFLIPNAFSPNGDGINDRWEIDYLEKFPGATIHVFNRYGQLVYQNMGYQRGSGWDGRKNGQALPMGAYYYIIDLKNGRPRFSGSVTILK